MRLYLLALCLPFSTAFATENCEFQARTYATALIGLVERALERQVIKVADLQEIVDHWSNPVEGKPNWPENFALRTAIGRSLLEVEEDQRSPLRTKISEIMRQHSATNEKVDAAREETKKVIAPTLLGPIVVRKEYRQLVGKVAESKFEGRPVFLALYSQALVLLDPLHADSNKRFQTIATNPPGYLWRHFGFTHQGGKVFAQALEPHFTYDLAAEQQVQLAPDETLRVEEFIREGKKFAVTKWSNTSIRALGPGTLEVTYPKQPKHYNSGATIFMIAGRPYLCFEEIQISEHGEHSRGQMVRIDLETKEEVRSSQIFDFYSPTVHLHWKSEPLSYVVSEELYQFNWQTMRGESLFKTQGKVHAFEWEGRNFILMDQRLIETHNYSTVGQVNIPFSIQHLKIFTHNGHTKALAFATDKMPELIQLTGDEH